MQRPPEKKPYLLREENRYLWYILILPAFVIAFFLEERLLAVEEYWVSWIPLDDRIPFCEYFVLPYVLWYPFLFGVGLYLLLKDHEGFKKYMLSIGLNFFSVLLLYLLFPNGQDLRPASFPRENLFTALLGLIYAADNNLNVLPSMHVLGSIAAALAVCMTPKLRSCWWRIGAVLLALLISLSTAFVKQHSILDAFVAVPVAAAVFLLVYRPWRGRPRKGRWRLRSK